MILRQIRNRSRSSFTYLVGDAKTQSAVLIDPTPEQVDHDLGLLDSLGLKLDYVLLTHRDRDHAAAARAIRQQTGARLVQGEGAGEGADLIVHGGDHLKIGPQDVTVLSTPGAAGSVSFLIGRRVFTGDVLAVRACGNRCVPADAGKLFDSVVDVLFALPDDTLVYPAHDEGGVPVTTIGAERRFNPDVASRDRAAFVARRTPSPSLRAVDAASPGRMAC